jgi:MFS family permease
MTVATRERQNNLSLLAIVAEGFLSRLSFGLVSFALPLYAYQLGFSLAEIGLLASLNLAVALALKPLMGWVADRFGLKRSFLASIGLRSIVALFLSFAVVPWQLYAIRMVHGISKSLRDPTADALIAENGGRKAIASAFAWHQTAKSVAGAIGKSAAGILLTLTASNFSLVFFVAFLLSALPMLAARFIQEREGTLSEPASSDSKLLLPDPDIPRKTNMRQILPFMGMGFLISSTAEMLAGLFPIIVTEYAGLSAAQAGILYLLSTLVILLAGPFFGWLSDHVSRNLVFLVRGLANTLSSVLYVVAPSFIGVTVARLTDDAGKAAFRPAWGSLMAQISGLDRSNRARTIGYLSAGEDVGYIFGPILAGLLWSTWGLPVMMGARILLAILAEVYTIRLTGNKKDPIEALLRVRKLAPTSNVVRVGDLEIEPAAWRVNSDGRRVQLSPVEFRLLACLAKRVGQLVNHVTILDEVWGWKEEYGALAQLKNYIGRLRKKIEVDLHHPQYIITIPGEGYWLRNQRQWEENRREAAVQKDEALS